MNTWYLKKFAEVEENPEAHPGYCIRNDRFYRHFLDTTNPYIVEMTKPWKLCVPKAARKTVLQKNYDEPTAGHLGIAKTAADVATKYYWPGMFRDIARYIRSCPSCQQYVQSHPPPLLKPSSRK